MHTAQNTKLTSTQNDYEKLRIEQKKKGFNYFNKTSKESDMGIRVVDTSRSSIPVTDLMKSSKNLQNSNTPGLETRQRKWK